MGLFALSYLVRAQLPELDDVSFGVEAARLTQDGIVMDRPHITGTSAKGQRFEVRAAKAWGNPDNAKLINFEAIEAEVGLKEGGEAVVTAREGLYDSERETLTIAGDVRVRSTSGYGVEASRAFVDFRSGSLRTEEPLLLQTGEARIEASGAVVDGAERAAEFMGRVRMTITPGPETMQ